MTKGTPYTLCLAESTREALQSPLDDLVYIDEFEVRGRQGRVKLWSISGSRTRRPLRVVRTTAPSARGLCAAVHKDAKVELISEVPLFSNCSKKELQQIASVADQVDLPKGKCSSAGRPRPRVLRPARREGRGGARRARPHAVERRLLRRDRPRREHAAHRDGDHEDAGAGARDHRPRASASCSRKSPEIQLKVLQALADRLAPAVL